MLPNVVFLVNKDYQNAPICINAVFHSTGKVVTSTCQLKKKFSSLTKHDWALPLRQDPGTATYAYMLLVFITP